MDINIALLPGDGIGPEIIAEATKVLDRTAAKFGHRIRYTEALVGAAAIDATGNPYPDTTHCICREADAVLFGAIGDPKYDNNPKAKVRPEQGLLRMRKALGLFANLRPVTVYEPLVDRSPLKADVVRGTDFICVRELTSGIYFGRQGRDRHDTRAYDTCTYTIDEIEQVLRVAFRLAGTRRRHLTVVDKANVLETSRMWRETAQRTACEYPDVTVDFMFVDNAAMQIIRRPTDFDVIVTENMFGDILTDEASVISGSLGMLSSASIGAKCALFEPVHGSYPQAAGKDIANPMAAVLSAALLLEHLGLGAEGRAVRKAIDRTLAAGVVTEDRLYSIYKTQGTLENLNIYLVGDLKYGRTVHSLLMAMRHFNPTFHFIAPEELKMPEEYKIYCKEHHIKYKEYTDFNEETIADADILYMTRVQRERFTDLMEYERVKDVYILRNKMLEHTRPNLRILHPLPRVNEIAYDVDENPKAYYFQQAQNGLYARQAILCDVLGITLNDVIEDAKK